MAVLKSGYPVSLGIEMLGNCMNMTNYDKKKHFLLMVNIRLVIKVKVAGGRNEIQEVKMTWVTRK